MKNNFIKACLIAVSIICSGNFLWAQAKVSTAGKNVHIIDTSFYMPQLKRNRRIWIYLPDS
jgi:hypothetical protein